MGTVFMSYFFPIVGEVLLLQQFRTHSKLSNPNISKGAKDNKSRRIIDRQTWIGIFIEDRSGLDIHHGAPYCCQLNTGLYIKVKVTRYSFSYLSQCLNYTINPKSVSTIKMHRLWWVKDHVRSEVVRNWNLNEYTHTSNTTRQNESFPGGAPMQKLNFHNPIGKGQLDPPKWNRWEIK